MNMNAMGSAHLLLWVLSSVFSLVLSVVSVPLSALSWVLPSVLPSVFVSGPLSALLWVLPSVLPSVFLSGRSLLVRPNDRIASKVVWSQFYACRIYLVSDNIHCLHYNRNIVRLSFDIRCGW